MLLTLASLAAAAFGWAGLQSPVFRGGSIGDRFHYYVLVTDGLLRVYTFEAEEPIYLQTTAGYRLVAIRRTSNDAVVIRYYHERPGPLKPYAIVTDTHHPPLGRDVPTLYMRGVRMPTTLPAALFIAYPVVALGRLRVRRHRLKPGHCPACAYNLRGNTSGVCPECGWTIKPPTCPTCKCDLRDHTPGRCPKCGTSFTAQRPV